MSVVSVPFESTGDGSICCGYGLGGGARESDGPDDLQDSFSSSPAALRALSELRLTSSRYC